VDQIKFNTDLEINKEAEFFVFTKKKYFYILEYCFNMVYTIEQF